ncbi:MAG: hypothetical protein CDV28_10840 [Candidatus Electronema aureum]|uniref:Uncharacterized protein n=1 Tax=Candidatus Electronema aureum TaxID=2005002 RepID=A0A521G348_9BACT|nr:MAG: hypothetical protein CDV28_10840 [Candidatus Electronema aureum]
MNKAHKELLRQCLGFDWDKGNIEKNQIKHNVSPSECEQVFFNNPLLIHDDLLHSAEEKRFYALGRSDLNRTLFVVFTIRNSIIRVISARDMSRKERKAYGDEKETA